MFLDFINKTIAFIMSILTGLTGGAGVDLSSMPSTNEQVQTSQPSPSPKPTVNGGMKPDADGCVKSDPNYMQCKMNTSPVGKKNPNLSPNDIIIARQQQYEDIVRLRGKNNPIELNNDLNRSAQAFAEVLANTPGGNIWHSTNRPYGVRENVGKDEIGYKSFVAMFSQSPGHASNMAISGSAPKVGIGIAQDPVTGYYYCVQHFRSS